MTCFSPVALKKPRSMREGVVTDALPMNVPCGRCDGCLFERSRQWGVRCMHEKSMHDSSLFLTLSYNDDNLVWGDKYPTLFKPHLQKFFKRLRSRLGYKIRHYSCGEYGSKFKRPHYHSICFGLKIPDLTFYRMSDTGNKIYVSPFLNEVWSHGDVFIGDVTFQSCAYVARYTLKKSFGPAAQVYKELGIIPEFSTCSLKPGIGASWLDKYFFDVFPHDNIVMDSGIKTKPPRYYLKLLEKRLPTLYSDIVDARRILLQNEVSFEENSPRRLKARQAVFRAKTKNIRRSD